MEENTIPAGEAIKAADTPEVNPAVTQAPAPSDAEPQAPGPVELPAQNKTVTVVGSQYPLQ